MAVTLNVNAVQSFDAHCDASSQCQRWQRWLRSFELYVGASGVTDDTQIRELLLHCAGESVQDIFFTLADTGNTYETAKAKITAYFTPRKNTSYNRHMFRKACQNDEESVAQYVTRLRQLAHLCEFGDQVDDFIRDQVIDNGRSKRLRTKLLAERDLNLESLTLLVQWRLQRAKRHRFLKVVSVRTWYTGKSKVADPHSKPCRKNKNANHISTQMTAPVVVCRIAGEMPARDMAVADTRLMHVSAHKTPSVSIVESPSFQQNVHAQSCARPRVPIKSKHVVRHVSEPTSGSEEAYENEYAYTTTHGETVTVAIANIQTTMLIDSGSTCNIINTACKDMLVQQGVPLTACHRKIHSYSSPPIRVRQLVDAIIMLDDGQSIISEFLIVEGDATPLLGGKATADKLGLLRVGVCHVTGSDEYRHKVVDRFPKLWTVIGCLKGVEVKLHIDKSVPPVAVRHNRVPFHQQQKVAKEIATLEAADVIEKVSGPTEWVSRIVTPPKPEEIRLCVDMCKQSHSVHTTCDTDPRRTYHAVQWCNNLQ